MSPKRKPRSLYDFSICHISSDLDAHCCTDGATFEAIMAYLTMSLPFTLQSNIGEWIAEKAHALLQPLLPPQVHLLLRLRTTRLVITGSVVECGGVDNQNAAAIRKLTLQYGGSETRLPRIYSFLQSATLLTHLECNNFCNDAMLSIISSSCVNLHCLDLRSCNVTDNGIIQLCGLDLDLETCLDLLSKGVAISPASACSKTLREIKITMTPVKEPGIAIVLLVLTKLVLLRVPDIRMENIFPFLQTIEGGNIQNNLKEFHSRQQLDESQIEVLSNICPNLEYIQVSFMGNFELDLMRMEQLVRLRRLVRAKFADLDSSALLWFLGQRGDQIQELYLYTFPPKFSQEKVTITRHQLLRMAESCPNIVSLCLDGYCLTDDGSSADCVKCFRKLKRLRLNSICLSEEELKLFVMESYQIEELDINLQNPYLLNDQIVDQILKNGLWNCLKSIRILNSPLTNKSLHRLIQECPSLTHISQIETWLIPKPKISEYKTWILQNNYELQIF